MNAQLDDDVTMLWEPTEALPGTPEKIIVMQRRADLKMPLQHPDDAWRTRVEEVDARGETQGKATRGTESRRLQLCTSGLEGDGVEACCD